MRGHCHTARHGLWHLQCSWSSSSPAPFTPPQLGSPHLLCIRDLRVPASPGQAVSGVRAKKPGSVGRQPWSLGQEEQGCPPLLHAWRRSPLAFRLSKMDSCLPPAELPHLSWSTTHKAGPHYRGQRGDLSRNELSPCGNAAGNPHVESLLSSTRAQLLPANTK